MYYSSHQNSLVVVLQVYRMAVLCADHNRKRAKRQKETIAAITELALQAGMHTSPAVMATTATAVGPIMRHTNPPAPPDNQPPPPPRGGIATFAKAVKTKNV